MNALYKFSLAGCAVLATMVFFPLSAWAGGAGPAATDVVYNIPSIAPGFWSRDNDTSWRPLQSTGAPDHFVVWDLDDSGIDDIFACWTGTSPPDGCFKSIDGGEWVKVTNENAVALAAGNFIGSGVKGDVAIIFDQDGPAGTWVYQDDFAITLMNANTPNSISAGDLDGNGLDELVASYDTDGADPGLEGVYRASGFNFVKILNVVAEMSYARGNLDGDAQDREDVQYTVKGESGHYVWRSDTETSVRVTTSTPNLFAHAELDGTAGDEAVASYDSPAGMWYFDLDGTDFTQFTNSVATSLATGQIDGDGGGIDEVITGFSDPVGAWTWRNNTAWMQESAGEATAAAAGEITGD